MDTAVFPCDAAWRSTQCAVISGRGDAVPRESLYGPQAELGSPEQIRRGAGRPARSHSVCYGPLAVPSANRLLREAGGPVLFLPLLRARSWHRVLAAAGSRPAGWPQTRGSQTCCKELRKERNEVRRRVRPLRVLS